MDIVACFLEMIKNCRRYIPLKKYTDAKKRAEAEGNKEASDIFSSIIDIGDENDKLLTELFKNDSIINLQELLISENPLFKKTFSKSSTVERTLFTLYRYNVSELQYDIALLVEKKFSENPKKFQSSEEIHDMLLSPDNEIFKRKKKNGDWCWTENDNIINKLSQTIFRGKNIQFAKDFIALRHAIAHPLFRNELPDINKIHDIIKDSWNLINTAKDFVIEKVKENSSSRHS